MCCGGGGSNISVQPYVFVNKMKASDFFHKKDEVSPLHSLQRRNVDNVFLPTLKLALTFQRVRRILDYKRQTCVMLFKYETPNKALLVSSGSI